MAAKFLLNSLYTIFDSEETNMGSLSIPKIKAPLIFLKAIALGSN